LVNNSYQQIKILNHRTPIEDVLKDPAVDAETKRKLGLAEEALSFGQSHLGLVKNKSYQTYVDIHRPYVTWIVQASPVDQIVAYTWWFPIVGSVPYKGYYTEQEAKEAAKAFDPQQFDTAVRGATAYSTLGWFHDPILSSMLRYEDQDLVETILHETVHATLFIPNHADFNERLANFLGSKGAELFYIEKEGAASKTAETIRLENADHLLFSAWISQQIANLREFYKNHPSREAKSQRLNNLAEDFQKNLQPKLKTHAFSYFPQLKLNNAVLLNYTTYDEDLTDFDRLYQVLGDYRSVLRFMKNLESSSEPQTELKNFLAHSSAE
jgi:predicted aminopeptidase